MIVRTLICLAALLSLSACGFQPLYATGQGSAGAGLNNVAFEGLVAGGEIDAFVRTALERRTAENAGAADYALTVSAREQAERLAVQIDASVTRYNYRLIGNYVLTDRRTGEQLKGSAQAISSFNVVSSQYSTLYAERAAREKAADNLVHEIERDILMKLAELEDE